MGLRRNLLLLVAVAGLCAATPAHACNVPVFRYALERWKPDLYEAVLFHEGPLTPELVQLAGELRQTDERGRSVANLRLTTVDLQGTLDDATRALWQKQSGAIAPWLVVRFPSALMLDRAMWSGPADPAAVDSLLHSPARKELSRQLLAGHSNVWLVIESGDADQDRQVVESLDRELKKLATTIKLPDESAQPGGVLKLPEDRGEGVLSKVPLGIEFSVIRVSRRDAAERFLLANILQTDEGLAAETGVVALPVFGRGRALRAFPGMELDAGTIAEVEDFLCGACSCSVKAQNPGMDLLLAANWEAAMAIEAPAAESEPTETAGPTLVAIPTGQPAPASISAVDSGHGELASQVADGSSLKLLLAAAALACAVVGVIGVLALRR